MLEDLSGTVVARVVHLKRVEDGFLQKRGIRLARNGFDDLSQQDITGITVVELLARLELERLVLEPGDKLRKGDTVGQSFEKIRE